MIGYNMGKFNIDDLVLVDDKSTIFTVVGIREFEIELEDDTSCKWYDITNISHYVGNVETDNEKWDFLYNKMDDEGFHYCFKYYSNWVDIKDDRFHQLRSEYLNSADELKKYIQGKVDDSFSF